MTTRRLWGLDVDNAPFIELTDSSQFRVTFDVDIRPSESVCFATIRIYNLAQSSAIKQKSKLLLRAGYTNAVDIIFDGSVTNTYREREGADVVTRLICMSGYAISDRRSAQLSFGQNCTLLDILRGLAQAWPLPLAIDESQFADVPPFSSGYTVDGDIPTTLNRLAYACKFSWLNERGQLVVTRPNNSRSGTVTEVSQFTGMVGIPEIVRGPNGLGVFVTTTLNPYFKCDGRINLVSEYATFSTGNQYVSENTDDAKADGEYNILKLSHRGDSWGNSWITEIDAIRAGTFEEPTEPKNVPAGDLIWGRGRSPEFKVKVKEICSNLGIDPNWLMACMAFETGRTFSPSVKSKVSSATGLIQFIEKTATGLGTSTAALGRMTDVEQLDYVFKYFKKGVRPIRNLGDCYMQIFAPMGVGLPDDTQLYIEGSTEYKVNSPLDAPPKKGYITRGDCLREVTKAHDDGLDYIG